MVELDIRRRRSILLPAYRADLGAVYFKCLEMLDFRFYLIDPYGLIAVREEGQYASDADAIAEFSNRHPGAKAELWQGKRLVAEFDGATVQSAPWR